jgi:hypothetical protein
MNSLFITGLSGKTHKHAPRKASTGAGLTGLTGLSVCTAHVRVNKSISFI